MFHHFSRLIDIITLPTSKGPMIVSMLRNPGGDRLRKISNVKIVFQLAKERGIDIGGKSYSDYKNF